jgi:hypothetical protein
VQGDLPERVFGECIRHKVDGDGELWPTGKKSKQLEVLEMKRNVIEKKINSDIGLQFNIVFVIMAILGFMMLAPMVAQANSGNSNPGVLPMNSKAFGMTYGDWSAKSWQWVLSIPADTNPLTDPTGEFCGEGQSGKVWFLAGNFGGSSERNCTVPAGKAILFPIINAEWSVVEANLYGGNCFLPDVVSGTNEEALRACAEAQIDHVTLKEASIDGTELYNLEKYRVQSQLFSFNLPEGNILGLDKGSSPSVSDGYWIILAPLSVGKHNVHFHGIADFPELPFTFETEVTYHLTIK